MGMLTVALTVKISIETGGRGVPNYLQSVTISPDGQLAAVPSKKDNVFRGFTRDGRPLTFENTVRTVVSIINFGGGYSAPATDTLDYRRDVNNADMATIWAPFSLTAATNCSGITFTPRSITS